MFGGIELGGTKCITVVGHGPGRIVALDRAPTTTPDETLSWAISRLHAYQLQHGTIEGIGLASFGPIDLRPGAATYGRLLNTPKRKWAGADIVGAVKDAFPGVAVGVGSDVDGAALSEGAAGAATDVSDFVYVTVGTGVGMGIVLDGKLVSGILHPEIGHVAVPRQPGDTYQGSCFAHGDCLEGMASGTAMTGRWGQRPEQLEGERLQTALIMEAGYLATGLRTAIYAFAPERIVIGGGVGLMAGLLPRLRQSLASALNGYPGLPEYESSDFVVTARLGDMAGPGGALEFAARAAKVS